MLLREFLNFKMSCCLWFTIHDDLVFLTLIFTPVAIATTTPLNLCSIEGGLTSQAKKQVSWSGSLVTRKAVAPNVVSRMTQMSFHNNNQRMSSLPLSTLSTPLSLSLSLSLTHPLSHSPFDGLFGGKLGDGSWWKTQQTFGWWNKCSQSCLTHTHTHIHSHTRTHT